MCLPVKPFKVESEFTHQGLKCAVTQPREAGSRCAYVRVPPGHPLHGKHYNDDWSEMDVSVHGGLTYSQVEKCEEKDGVGWWFGFDFCHCDDAMYDQTIKLEDIADPGMRQCVEIHRSFHRLQDGHWWTQAEAEAEARDLAEQLALMGLFAMPAPDIPAEIFVIVDTTRRAMEEATGALPTALVLSKKAAE